MVRILYLLRAELHGLREFFFSLCQMRFRVGGMSRKGSGNSADMMAHLALFPERLMEAARFKQIAFLGIDSKGEASWFTGMATHGYLAL